MFIDIVGVLGMWVGLVWIQGFVSVLFLYFWGYKRLNRSLIWFGLSDYSVLLIFKILGFY